MTKNRLNGTALRSILDTRGISISDLAKICGKNRALMSQWIGGKRNPRRGEVQKIADALRLNISEISDFSDDDFTAINLNIEDSIQEYRYIYEAAMSQLQKKVSECGQAKTAESIGVSGGYISLLLNEKAKISDIKLSAFLRLFPNIKIDFGVQDIPVDDRRARIHAMIDLLSDEQLAGLEPMLKVLLANKTE